MSDVNPSSTLPTAELARLHEHSARLLRTHQAPSGAWPASPDFAPYAFSWFRDGSFIADGASCAGLHAEAAAFHDWAAGVLIRAEPTVATVEEALAAGRSLPDEAYLPARWTVDGDRHDDGWWNFQVDGYGTWMWALERHLGRVSGSPARWRDAIEVALRYLAAAGLGTCRDWWEEHRDQRHVTTLAGVAAGLRAGVRLLGTDVEAALRERCLAEADAACDEIAAHGVRDGHLVKWLGGADVDASLLAVAALYDVLTVDDPRVLATVRAVEERLTGSRGPTGVHRYPSDTFYGGGQWPVLACLLSVQRSRSGDRAGALDLLTWVARQADAAGGLPEQVEPRLAPERLAEWEQRWGPSAHPLLWSHGAFLAAVDALPAHP